MTRLYLLLDLDHGRSKLLEDYGYRLPETAIQDLRTETGWPVVVPLDEAVLAHEMAVALLSIGIDWRQTGKPGFDANRVLCKPLEDP